MKVYVLYTIHWGDTRPLHISINKAVCEEEIMICRNGGSDATFWIEEFDFSEAEGFDLDLN